MAVVCRHEPPWSPWACQDVQQPFVVSNGSQGASFGEPWLTWAAFVGSADGLVDAGADDAFE
jgi:hypothetical protein